MNAVRYVEIRRHCEKPTNISNDDFARLALAFSEAALRCRALHPGAFSGYRLCRRTWLRLPGKGIYIKNDVHCMCPVSRSPYPYRLILPNPPACCSSPERQSRLLGAHTANH